jgi:hypothetical protein
MVVPQRWQATKFASSRSMSLGLISASHFGHFKDCFLQF